MSFTTKKLISIVIASIALSGCSLIFGGSQKVDNKSSNYKYLRLDRDKSGVNPNWIKVRAGLASDTSENAVAASDQEPDQADVAYENTKNNSIISLNSVCRPQRNFTLQELTNNLLMGLPNANQISQREFMVDNAPALETVVDTTDDHREPIRIKAVVLKKAGCTYDIMYIAKNEVYEQSLSDVERFLKGFHAD